MQFNSIRRPKPPRIIQLPVGYFQESYTEATPGTKIGIRRLAIGELQNCNDEADRFEENGFKSRHQALMVNVVAASLCDPIDVTKRYLKAGDMEARIAFTPEGISYLYDIILQLHLSTSPIYDEISDENLLILMNLLKSKTISKKLRRLLSYILDELAKLWKFVFRRLLKSVQNANCRRIIMMILVPIRINRITKTNIVTFVEENK